MAAVRAPQQPPLRPGTLSSRGEGILGVAGLNNDLFDVRLGAAREAPLRGSAAQDTSVGSCRTHARYPHPHARVKKALVAFLGVSVCERACVCTKG